MFDEARALVHACRVVFERERDIHLVKVYGALADLEDKVGNRETAVGFQVTALWQPDPGNTTKDRYLFAVTVTLRDAA